MRLPLASDTKVLAGLMTMLGRYAHPGTKEAIVLWLIGSELRDLIAWLIPSPRQHRPPLIQMPTTVSRNASGDTARSAET